MTRAAPHLVPALAEDIYTSTPAAAPRAVGSDEIDRLGVVTALDVLPERAPRSGVRRRGVAEMGWDR